MSSLEDQEFTFMKMLWTSPSWQSSDPAKEIFLEMLTTAIVKKSAPQELAALLAMLPPDKNTMGWKERAVLTGISIQGKNKMKPIRLAAEPKILAKRDANDDQLQTLAAMFEWPGHVADTSAVHQEKPT